MKVGHAHRFRDFVAAQANASRYVTTAASTREIAGGAIFYARGTCDMTSFVGGKAQCSQLSTVRTAKGAVRAATLPECFAFCETCSACTFVSFSRRQKECSWFAECDLQNVRRMNHSTTPGVARATSTFETWDMRRVPHRAERRRNASRAALVPDLTFLDDACGEDAARPSIAACPAQMLAYANATRSYLREELAASRTLQGCETGFNCGHSAALFLEQDPRLHMVSFDKFKWEWSRAGQKAMALKYGARSHQVRGDSITAVPKHWRPAIGEDRPTPPPCDLIHVDGGHTYVIALQDALHLIAHARCGALILMDDVCDPAHCTTYSPWAVGPSQAWAELLRMGVVRETVREGGCDRRWVMGRVVCRPPPTREPPPIRYPDGRLSTELHKSFSNDASVEDQRHTWVWPH
jgi:hypothetical protein